MNALATYPAVSALAAPHASGTEYNIDLGFRQHQWQALMWRVMKQNRYSAHVVHRRGGKTRFMVAALASAAAWYPNIHDTPGRFHYIAPLLKQAKDAAWFYLQAGCRRINEVNGTKETNRRTWFARVHESELFMEYRHNGARVKLYGGSDPDSIRGIYSDGAVLDEPAQMKAIVLTEVLMPMLQDHDGWLALIGTPKGLDFFHHCVHVLALNPGWGRTLIRASDTRGTLPWLSDEKLEQLKRDMSDIKYAQEMECDFNASAEDVLVTINDVLAAQERVIKTEHELRGLPKVMGIDLARYRDRSVMVKRWGALMYEPVVWKGGTDHMAVAGAIANEIRAWKPDAVFIDKAQSGTMADILRSVGCEVITIDFGAAAANAHYANKRAEMYATMARWVREVGVLPKNRELLTELTSVTYDFDLRDRLRLESKDDIRERLAEQELPSPDIADALALTFAMPVTPKALDEFQEQVLIGAGAGSMKDWKPGWQR